MVEELCFEVGPGERAAFLAADERVWTTFLRTCAGFVGKQVWVDPTRPDEVRVVIWWASQDAWDAVTPERVAEVDRAMGALLRPPVWVRAVEVVGVADRVVP